MKQKIYVNRENIIIYLLFLIVMYLYIIQIAPAYNSDDSPETTLAFVSLGIQHPPGYPLNTLIGKIFTFLPLGSYMFRANIMSSFFNILTGIFIFFIMKTILRKVVINNFITNILAFFTSLIFLLSKTPFLQSTFAKGSIYSLNSFLTTLLFWSILNIEKNIKYLYFFSFIYGLSLGNHWTSIIAISLSFLLYFLINFKKLKIKNIIKGISFFILGISIYLFIFIRNIKHPVYAWGDTKTLKDFLWLISRAQYSSIEGKHTIYDTLHLLNYSIKNLIFYEFPLFLSVFAFIGMFFSLKSKDKDIKNIFLMFFIAYFSILLSVCSFATPPKNTEWLIKPYLVSSNIFISIFIGFFIGFIYSKIKVEYKNILLFILTFVSIFYFFKNNPSYKYYYIGYDYTKNIAKSIKNNSLIFVEGDMNIGACLYESIVNKNKKFIPVATVVSQYDWYREQLLRNYNINLPPKNFDMNKYIKSIIFANLSKNIYYSNVYREEWLKGILLQPEGLINKVKIKYNKIKLDIAKNNLLLYSYRGLLGKYKKYDEFTQRLVIMNYGLAFFKIGDLFRNIKLYRYAIQYYKNGLLFYKNDGAYINIGLCYYLINDLKEAKYYWEKAIKMNPLSSVAYSNIAFIYLKENNIKKAEEYLRKALKINPDNITAKQLLIKIYKNSNNILHK